jgi:hypothetical protein
MRSLVSVGIFICLVGTAFGQGRRGQFWSLGGFGNVLYPGTGHAPVTPPGGFNGPRFPGGFAGRPGLRNPVPAAHPFHRRSAIVPYPVYYGAYGYGYGYGYDPSVDSGQGYSNQEPPIVNTNSAPSVVINQSFVPPQYNPQVREYGNTNDDAQSSAQEPAPAPRRTAADDQPTLYLIAFKDHSIVQALGYWMEGDNLHYVTVDHDLNQASLDLIDRDLSQRLNSERGLEFKLPAR